MNIGRINRPIFPLEVNECAGDPTSQATADAGNRENLNVKDNIPDDNTARGTSMRSLARKT